MDTFDLLIKLTPALIGGFFLVVILFTYHLLLLLFGSKRKSLKKALIFSVLLGLLVAALPVFLDMALNGISNKNFQFPPISNKARELHAKLWIADLHSDSLLWPSRNLLVKNQIGHMDLPRLLEGGVALQGFTMVTGIPPGMNMEKNEAPGLASDILTFKALVERWDVAALSSRAQRVVFQAQQLEHLAANSNHSLLLIKSAADLQNYLTLRKYSSSNITAAYLGIEGLHALDGELKNVDLFDQLGVRTMGITHFFDNELGGSAHGVNKNGLTEFGREVVKLIEKKKMFVDLAHASEKVIDDVIAMASRPIIVSHTGVRSVCDSVRNMKDDHIRGVAKSGGIIGIGYFKPAVCGDDELKSIIQSIKYVKELVGVKHVALGSDFDGAVKTPFDTTGLIHITQGLLSEGFTEEEIKLIMGDNVKALFLQYLP